MLPFPFPGDLPNPGIEPRSPALQADALPSEPPGNWEVLKLSSGHRTGKGQFSFQRKARLKNAHNQYHTIVLISHASKVMLNIFQARLQQYMNRELPDVQAGFRKGRGTRDQLPKSAGSSIKQECSRKYLFLLY